MGGSAPSAPTLDVGQSSDLLRKQLAIQRQEIPRMAEASGTASRAEYRRNIDFGLGLLGDASLRQRYEAAMPDEMRRRNALLAQLDAADASSPEYTRLQEQLQGAVGERAGMLSAQDTRDATQQARSAMAARGMATGNAGIGAELLNRDRYVQQRRAQDLGILGQSAQLSEQERMRRMGLGQDSYNFALSSNPNMMAIGAGSPYANLTQNSMAMVGNASGLNPMYSGGQFSGQGGGGFNMMGAGAGALSGAATGAMLGSVVPGIGTAVGAIGGGLIGGLGGGLGGSSLSDEREKTDIKPLGTLTDVLKIPAYEYRYKGEKKKRKGVMAQDVQKVLPEAVTEVDYQGKRRLAIKPGVIGAALAEELTNQTKAVAA
jgi:hypothetical protein